MSRASTTNLGLGTWDEEDNPGAGSKTVQGSGGLNDNFIMLDIAVGAAHNPDGSHKANTIDGPTLKTTVADGVTLNLTGSPLKLAIKLLGITGAYIAAATITAAKLATGCIDVAAKIVDGIITQAKMAANSIGTVQLIDANVTGPKISHNNTRTRYCLAVGSAYPGTNPLIGGAAVAPGVRGFCMPAGSIVGLYVNGSGTIYSATFNYGVNPFVATDQFTVQYFDDTAGGGSTHEMRVYKNGGIFCLCQVPSMSFTNGYVLTICVELD